MKYVKFIASVLLCFSVAFLGSAATTPSIPTWYASLSKPCFNPPNWVFGPVWTVLYLSMAVALYITWDKKISKKKKDKAVKIFIFQLILNLLWSLMFFGLHQLLLSVVVIIALWISILITIKYFIRISKWAGYLLIPYILWVSFAYILNFSILILNW